MALIKCKQCGAEMPDNASKCYKCGSTNTYKIEVEQKEKEKTEHQSNVFAIIGAIVILVSIYFIITGLWKDFKGDDLVDAMGVSVNGDTVTIKSKDKNKLKNWKNDAMHELGFSYEDE